MFYLYDCGIKHDIFFDESHPMDFISMLKDKGCKGEFPKIIIDRIEKSLNKKGEGDGKGDGNGNGENGPDKSGLKLTSELKEKLKKYSESNILQNLKFTTNKFKPTLIS